VFKPICLSFYLPQRLNRLRHQYGFEGDFVARVIWPNSSKPSKTGLGMTVMRIEHVMELIMNIS
jgi:hypothetical protein